VGRRIDGDRGFASAASVETTYHNGRKQGQGSCRESKPIFEVLDPKPKFINCHAL
jgi:hypothetical protein